MNGHTTIVAECNGVKRTFVIATSANPLSLFDYRLSQNSLKNVQSNNFTQNPVKVTNSQNYIKLEPKNTTSNHNILEDKQYKSTSYANPLNYNRPLYPINSTSVYNNCSSSLNISSLNSQWNYINPLYPRLPFSLSCVDNQATSFLNLNSIFSPLNSPNVCSQTAHTNNYLNHSIPIPYKNLSGYISPPVSYPNNINHLSQFNNVHTNQIISNLNNWNTLQHQQRLVLNASNIPASQSNANNHLIDNSLHSFLMQSSIPIPSTNILQSSNQLIRPIVQHHLVQNKLITQQQITGINDIPFHFSSDSMNPIRNPLIITSSNLLSPLHQYKPTLINQPKPLKPTRINKPVPIRPRISSVPCDSQLPNLITCTTSLNDKLNCNTVSSEFSNTLTSHTTLNNLSSSQNFNKLLQTISEIDDRSLQLDSLFDNIDNVLGSDTETNITKKGPISSLDNTSIIIKNYENSNTVNNSKIDKTCPFSRPPPSVSSLIAMKGSRTQKRVNNETTKNRKKRKKLVKKDDEDVDEESSADSWKPDEHAEEDDLDSLVDDLYPLLSSDECTSEGSSWLTDDSITIGKYKKQKKQRTRKKNFKNKFEDKALNDFVPELKNRRFRLRSKSKRKSGNKDLCIYLEKLVNLPESSIHFEDISKYSCCALTKQKKRRNIIINSDDEESFSIFKDDHSDTHDLMRSDKENACNGLEDAGDVKKNDDTSEITISKSNKRRIIYDSD